MKAPVRLGLYGLVLAVVFALSAVIADVVVPEQTVRDWVEQTEEVTHGEQTSHDAAGGYDTSGGYDTGGQRHDDGE